MSKTLKILGIIYLIASIVIAIVIICSNGTVENGSFYVDTETNLLAIGCSVGVIFQGVLVYCVVGGLAQVMDRSDEIANKLGITINSIVKDLKENEPTAKSVKRYKKCSVCGELNNENENFCCKCDHYLKDSEIILE